MKNRTFSRAAALALIFAFIGAAAFLASPTVSSQDRRRTHADVERVLESFDELTLDPVAALKSVKKGEGLTLETSHGTFELDLEPHDILAPNYRATAVFDGGEVRDLPRPPVNTYKGRVRGMKGAQARLTIDDGTVEGVIITPDQLYFIEPANRFSPAASAKDLVFYAASAAVQKNFGECGVTLAEQVSARADAFKFGEGHLAFAKGGTTEDLFVPTYEIELATDADFEYFQVFGTADATRQNIISIMNQIDGIYGPQLGLKFKIVFQNVWAAEPDPYTTTSPGGLLNEFATHWNANFDGVQREITHLWTGKDLGSGTPTPDDDSTIGIATRPGLNCADNSLAYGLSQHLSSASQRQLLTAHEIGHNLNAVHPNQQNPAPSGCANTIMSSSLGFSTQPNFCQFSLDEITGHTVQHTSCLTSLPAPGCSYALSSSQQTFPDAGGSGSVNITATAGCNWSVDEGEDWITITSALLANGNGIITYTVAAKPAGVGPRAARINVGGQPHTVAQPSATGCSLTSIVFGQLSGTLSNTDCRSGQRDRPNSFIDLYTFTGRAGQRVKIEMTATSALDTYLYLFGPGGTIVAENDDLVLGQNTNSRIPQQQSDFFTLPATGIYTIEATSFGNNDDGNYSISLTDNAATNTAALSSSAFTVDEGVGGDGLGTDGTGFRVVNVTRSGSDTSGTATVDFATSDGSAEARKDYEQTLGTLVFAPGETSKSFTVFVPDDRFSEAPETINITLSNPVGLTLGSPATAQLTINSNDAANSSSPVQGGPAFSAPFYVRQQYLDFLNREPDAGGFAFWQGQLNNCGSNEPCLDARRVNVSAAFYISIEFQETGFLVERIYKTAFGDATGSSTTGGAHTLPVPIVRLNEFLPDTQRIGQGVIVNVGNWEQQLEANKVAFALEFVLRQRYLSAFPLSMTPAEVVDKMNQNAGSVLTQAQRDQFVAELTASADVAAGRAKVLRQVAENPTLTTNEFNRAFVLMQYFGYLRRNPNDAPDTDYSGYEFWLSKLNQFNGNFVQAEMVKAFITSDEYVRRFGTQP